MKNENQSRNKRNGIKSAKKMLGLLRHDRHKRIRKSICAAVSKTEFGAGITFCRLRRHYVLKKEKFDLFSTGRGRCASQEEAKFPVIPLTPSPPPIPKGGGGGRDGGAEPVAKRPEQEKRSRRKYLIGSYLFNVVCKFPRKYGSFFLGKEVLRTYYTVPAGLSMTRFIAGKVLKEHYKTLSRNTLSNLAKSVRSSKGADRNQVAKKFIIGLEQRLDSSLLRLLRFAPARITKQASAKKRNDLQSSKKFLYKRPKFSQYLVKLPLSSFGAFHAKQLINHGHILVDGKKVKSGGRHISASHNQLEYRARDLQSASNLRGNHESTMLLRRLKDKAHLALLASPCPQRGQGGRAKEEEQAARAVEDYVGALKVKRFTEIFYMTYRNLHWIERINPCLGSNDVEKHIQPVISTIGFNQSIYLLWPVLSLLQVYRWGPSAKRNLLQFGSLGTDGRRKGEASIEEKTRSSLKNLLRWKRLFPLSRPFGDGGAGRGANAKIGIVEQLSAWTCADREAGEPSYLKNAQKAIFGAQSYALIVYGTRTCKWVKLQQQGKGDFYKNQIFRKSHFLELELEFFQWIHQAYAL